MADFSRAKQKNAGVHLLKNFSCHQRPRKRSEEKETWIESSSQQEFDCQGRGLGQGLWRTIRKSRRKKKKTKVVC